MEVDRNRMIVTTVAISCVTILLWGFFIWPTPFLYQKVSRP